MEKSCTKCAPKANPISDPILESIGMHTILQKKAKKRAKYLKI